MTSSHSSASSPVGTRAAPPLTTNGRTRATLRRASRRVASGISRTLRRLSSTQVTPISTAIPDLVPETSAQTDTRDTEDEGDLVPFDDHDNAERLGGYKLYYMNYIYATFPLAPTFEDDSRWRAFEDKFLAWCHQGKEEGGAGDCRPDDEIVISRERAKMDDEGRFVPNFEKGCDETIILANDEELRWLRTNGCDILSRISVDVVAYGLCAAVISPIKAGFFRNAAWGLGRISNRQNTRTVDYMYDDNGGQGITVYIMDSGINEDVTDRSGQLEFADQHGNSRVRKGFNVWPTEPFRDLVPGGGHGTHVAGIVGSRTYGVAKNVSLVDVKTANYNGDTSERSWRRAAKWVLHDITLRNAFSTSIVHSSMSLQSSKHGPCEALNQVVDRVVLSGVPWVTAAGNEFTDAPHSSSAAVPQLVCVGASDAQDKLAIFDRPDRLDRFLGGLFTSQVPTTQGSNWGPRVDIWAPGHSIISTATNNQGYATLSGTSQAAPFVSGQLAIDMGVAGRRLGKAHLLTTRCNTLCRVDTNGKGPPGQLL